MRITQPGTITRAKLCVFVRITCFVLRERQKCQQQLKYQDYLINVKRTSSATLIDGRELSQRVYPRRGSGLVV